jgi:DNA replicative helicase MCM subunit Mcm2 (Cdc46/Mcm family)
VKTADFLIAFPSTIISWFEEAAKDAQNAILAKHPRRNEMKLKENVHIRICRLPICDKLSKVTMPRSSDITHFVELSGTVIRTGMNKSLEAEKALECSTCKYVFQVKTDLEQYNNFPKVTCKIEITV